MGVPLLLEMPMKTLTLTEAKARRGKEVLSFRTGDVLVVSQEGDPELLEKGLALVAKHKARMRPESIKAKLDAVRHGRHGG